MGVSDDDEVGVRKRSRRARELLLRRLDIEIVVAGIRMNDRNVQSVDSAFDFRWQRSEKRLRDGVDRRRRPLSRLLRRALEAGRQHVPPVECDRVVFVTTHTNRRRLPEERYDVIRVWPEPDQIAGTDHPVCGGQRPERLDICVDIRNQ
jgi:hypothetical protein